jgi:hypothetical protein
MKKSLLLAGIVLSGFALNAQSVSPDVISSGGDFFSSLSGSVSWTLGEPMGETYSAPNHFLTQGFQQTWGIGASVGGSDPVNAEVYPNPTSDFVYLQFGDRASGSYVIEVFNTLGQQLSAQNFTATPSAKATVSLASFADGIYFISVKKADGTQTSTYRITKNS